MKLAGLLRLILAVACLSSGALAARAEPFRFTILYAHSTTDLEEARPRGGLPRLAALVRQERAERGTVLVLHGGQTLAPSVLAFYDQGAHIIDLLNGIGPDVMAALNREFHHGDDKLMTRAFEAGFPMITTNAIDRATGKPPDGLESAVVLRAGPFRVGVLAGTPLQTKETTRTPQTEFRDPAVAIAERARAMKAEGVDLTVALTSSSGNTHTAVIAARPTDIVLYQDRGRDIGVDYDGKFLSATVAPQANYVLALDITIDRVGERDSQRLVWSPSVRVIDTATISPDPDLDARTRAYSARLDGLLSMEVGRLEENIDTRRETVRGGESAFANTVVDTLRLALDADVALFNGGGIRGDRSYAAGTVLTRHDIYSELPYHDVGVVLDVTGQQLWEAVESGVSGIEQLQGRFPHLSNARVVVDATRPPGRRVVDLAIGGKPVDRASHYRLATSSYLAAGGDGYSMLVSAPRLLEERDSDFVSTLLIATITRTGVFAPRLDGRMTVKR